MPTKIKLVYLPEALGDLEEIVKFHIGRVGVASGRATYAAIREPIAKLSAFPLMGQTHPDPVLASHGFRKLVTKSPYVCIYKVFSDTVYIYRIVNGATDYPKLLY